MGGSFQRGLLGGVLQTDNAETDEQDTGPLSRVQAKILEFVESEPGATITSVATRLGCTHPTAAYHLKAMVRRGTLTKYREGRTVRHYLRSRDTTVDRLSPLLRSPRRKAVILFLATQPVHRMTINRIAWKLATGYGVVKRTIQQLDEQGLASMDMHRNQYVIRLDPRLRDLLRDLGHLDGDD